MSEHSSPGMDIVQRDNAYAEIDRVADMAASYARSTGEAAYRGDQVTMEAGLRQLRLCVVHMIKTYKDYLEGKSGAV